MDARFCLVRLLTEIIVLITDNDFNLWHTSWLKHFERTNVRFGKCLSFAYSQQFYLFVRFNKKKM